MAVNRHPVHRPDDAKHAGSWAAGCAGLIGACAAIVCTVGLVQLVAGASRGAAAWVLPGLLGGTALMGAAWRLTTHVEQRRGAALAPILAQQAGLLLTGLALLALLSSRSGFGGRAPDGASVFVTLLLLAGPSLLNLRALVLCGGPHWRRIAPEWLVQCFAAGKTLLVIAFVFGLFIAPGAGHR